MSKNKDLNNNGYQPVDKGYQPRSVVQDGYQPAQQPTAGHQPINAPSGGTAPSNTLTSSSVAPPPKKD
jgi:hypothetical protein